MNIDVFPMTCGDMENQKFMKRIPCWNSNLLEKEVYRIINESKCDWLNDLLKAVIKANIIGIIVT